jgi:hypothetical protein
MVVLSTFTHWPAEQSADVWQASWHFPMVHTRGWVQSLFMMQVPPASILFSELQPAASQTEAAIKPRMRNHDTDISILQLCFAIREKRAPRKISQHRPVAVAMEISRPMGSVPRQCRTRAARPRPGDS